jgi:eukaryotic-like serine/threonine-protein kinase
MAALAALAPGTVFAGDYRIVRPLASGGMGAVYVAMQLSTGKQRALKVMLPALVGSPELLRRFEQEARIGAHIASEHVVEVQAAGVDAPTGFPYLVMELLDGADLAETLRVRRSLPPAEAKVVFEQLCHALAAAHASGVVHRDLKPQNVFLARTMRADVAFTVKVLDFGIAKLLDDGAMTSTSGLGTPLWLAPEQSDRRPVTPATDVWSLGLLAFHVLTGIHYWPCMDHPQPTVTELLREVLVDPLPLASQRAPALPPGFDAWFQRCVVRDPQLRFPSAREAGAAISHVLSGGQMAAYSYPPAPSHPQPAPMAAPPAAPSSVLLPLLIAGGIIVSIFLFGGFATLLWLNEPSHVSHASDAGDDAFSPQRQPH